MNERETSLRALKVPDQGTPELIVDESRFAAAINELKSGQGPIAIDAERASGFRYSSRAYLIQIYRRGGGLHLIDPIEFSDSPLIGQLSAVIRSAETIIHASTQDLPCLRQWGLDPKDLFDTELGARIAGLPRVGLGYLVESLLQIQLAKEHSAVDWSIRPLEPEWLDYAALDVALLIDLRDKIAELLESEGRLTWAMQDSAAILRSSPPEKRKEPWRRTSGMHEIKSRYQLAIIRQLWQVREEIAASIDLAPGRLLSDAVIIALAKSNVKSRDELMKLPEAKSRIRNEIQKSYIDIWLETFLAAQHLDEEQWPALRSRSDSLPPARIWKVRFPLAHAHLSHAKAKLGQIARELSLPLENLLGPDVVRKLCFDQAREQVYEMSQVLLEKVEGQLRLNGAREWQIEKCAQALAESLGQGEPLPSPASEPEAENQP
ncbi:MAG: ribonuclease D [Actinobacteria bacterium]|nr:ribonuclease D [Actinomycetota bacterium]